MAPRCLGGRLTRLQETGIKRTYAIEILLRAIETRAVHANRNTVLVVDEISQIGPRQILKLLELQAKTGMTIKMLGDREQAQAIEAGDAMQLLQRASQIGAAGIVYDRSAAKRARPRNCGPVPRGRRGDGLVDEARRRPRDATRRRPRPGRRTDRRPLHLPPRYPPQWRRGPLDHRVRTDERGRGRNRSGDQGAAEGEREIGQHESVYQAVDQTGQTYDLSIAAGDRVRLFRKTWGTVDGQAKQVGNNGNVVTVLAELADGLRIRTQDGEVADVKWQKLIDGKTKRLFLGHGHAITIDFSPGHHIGRAHQCATPR